MPLPGSKNLFQFQGNTRRFHFLKFQNDAAFG
jgi:hypothetical protein